MVLIVLKTIQSTLCRVLQLRHQQLRQFTTGVVAMSSSKPIRFDGKVVLVTGAGNGLGKAYALAFGARGAKVVVNDLGGDFKGSGKSSRPADLVVEEIKANGGTAVANYDSVENGENLVKTALDNFGRIDVIVNNAGILRDRSFARITDDDWDIIQRVHLRGTFLVCRAAWPHMKRQKYGRIVNVSSTSGLYGNFGQSNYSAAKMGIVGLSKTLAREGEKDNIICNILAPTAGSRMTETVMAKEMVDALKPDFVAPLVLWLAHEDITDSGCIYECGGGMVMKTRLQRSAGVMLRNSNKEMTPEAVRDSWEEIGSFDNPNYPTNSREAGMPVLAAIMSSDASGDNSSIKTNKTAASSSLELVIGAKMKELVHTYTERDVILYALGVGVSTSQPDHLKFLFEGNPEFCVLPTYGVIASMIPIGPTIMDGSLGNVQINPAMILHGEQYLELLKPLKQSDAITCRGTIVDVLDKGSGAVIVANVDGFDPSGTKILTSQSIIFLQKAGGFGGRRSSDKIVPLYEPPKGRAPDATIEEKTFIDQAALYRLNGDRNPLHIDPGFAALGGFPKPILHGLCSFGIAARHVLKQYCGNDVYKFKSIKVRFSSPVIPGQTLRTDMWKDGSRVYIKCTVVETGKACLSGAYVDLFEGGVTGVNQSLGFTHLKSEGLLKTLVDKVKSKPDLVKKVNSVYLYKIKDSTGTIHPFTLDLSASSGPRVFSGAPESHGERPAGCTISITDDDLVNVASGKTSALNLFTSGKIKAEGNVSLAMKLEGVFGELSKL